MKFSYLFLLLIFMACSTTGQNKVEVESTSTLPSSRELRQALRKQRAITLVYSSGIFEQQYRQMAEQIAAASSYIAIEVVSEKNLDEAAQKDKILFLIGAPQSNAIIRKTLDKLPLKMSEKNLEFAGKQFSKANTFLRVSGYPSPFNPRHPLYLITGFEDESILQQMEKLYGQEWGSLIWASRGYQIFEDHSCSILGYFSQPDWAIDPQTHWDFSNSLDTVFQTPHFEFISHRLDLPLNELEAMGERCEKTLSYIELFCEQEVNFGKIQQHLYNSAEEKGLLLFNTLQSHIDPTNNSVHTVINEEYRDIFLHKENELILRHLLGKSAHPFLEEGLGVYFTRQWQGKGYQHWATRLHNSGNRMPLSELLNQDLYKRESPLIKTCMAASFVDFLVVEWGRETFLSRYKNWQPNAQEIDRLDQKWSRYLDQQIKSKMLTFPTAKRQSTLPYWQGFNFAHEGYQIYNGYISKGANLSLKKLKDLGSNAIAIVPYSYMDDPHIATFLPFTQSAGSENDESVIHVIHAARALGIQSLVKPQVWLGHGSWSGFVKMDSPEEWAQFFDYYYRWIRHFAMLSEIHGAEALSVGVEFGNATLGHEEEWKNIFQKLRGIYSGQLTYCANWGEEFENVSFWQELDFIGLNCYYPLSKSDRPSKKDLVQNFENILKKVTQIAEAYDKPIVFTEIGFRPVEGTWKDPHDAPKGRTFDAEAQRLCYEVVLEGIEGKDWCNGILWWKWPSYMEYSQERGSGFTPSGREAEGVVKRFFEK